ncbi:hypothetical protein GCM10023336_45220 [Streptomyces similanensis]|uniref:Integrase catalytic domain-containing protein n=1 Tax=Streptomyces similanensis TaxID=1274988 RepID=A0ABP9KVS2_9ACTN
MNRFQCVADLRAEHGVKRLCRVLGIARSSFYYWQATALARAARQAADEKLTTKIAAVHAASDGTYGVPRVTTEFRESGGEPVNHKKVARLMKTAGIARFRLRRKHRTTVADPAAAKASDLIGRDFTATEVNTKYVGDITYLPVGGGKFCYLATVIDLASRRLAGWAIADHMRAELVVDTLAAAERTRGSLAAAIMHTDHGAQYTSRAFADACRRAGVRQSRRRLQRGQRRGGELERDHETRDPPEPKELVKRARSPPRTLPLAAPLQHRPPPQPPGTPQPHHLRTRARPNINYADASRITPCPTSGVRPPPVTCCPPGLRTICG